MPELLIELLAGLGVIVLSLIGYFYLYPEMKKEYERNGWTWKRIYDIEVDNRRSYREIYEFVVSVLCNVVVGNV